MKNERIYTVLKGPHISEKATLVADSNKQILFKVVTTATKKEIARAVEVIFNVKVKAVNVVNMKGKTKRSGQRFGKRKDWKKAYVSLHKDYDIDFAAAE